MNEKTFSLIKTLIIGISACAMFYIFAQTIMVGNRQYYDLVKNCNELGGIWINHTYQCVRK